MYACRSYEESVYETFQIAVVTQRFSFYNKFHVILLYFYMHLCFSAKLLSLRFMYVKENKVEFFH